MLTQLRPALATVLAFTLILGLAYPLALTGIARLAFPAAAEGSLVRVDGHVVGSRLIGQMFTAPRYFHPRPSATATPYDAAGSGGSNLGPTSAALKARLAAAMAAEGPSGPVPADAVMASGSGLDPDISPQNALRQVARVAAARGLNPDTVAALVARMTVQPAFGFVGEPHVNVLALNLALDKPGLQ